MLHNKSSDVISEKDGETSTMATELVTKEKPAVERGKDKEVTEIGINIALENQQGKVIYPQQTSQKPLEHHQLESKSNNISESSMRETSVSSKISAEAVTENENNKNLNLKATTENINKQHQENITTKFKINETNMAGNNPTLMPNDKITSSDASIISDKRGDHISTDHQPETEIDKTTKNESINSHELSGKVQRENANASEKTEKNQYHDEVPSNDNKNDENTPAPEFITLSELIHSNDSNLQKSHTDGNVASKVPVDIDTIKVAILYDLNSQILNQKNMPSNISENSESTKQITTNGFTSQKPLSDENITPKISEVSQTVKSTILNNTSPQRTLDEKMTSKISDATHSIKLTSLNDSSDNETMPSKFSKTLTKFAFPNGSNSQTSLKVVDSAEKSREVQDKANPSRKETFAVDKDEHLTNDNQHMKGHFTTTAVHHPEALSTKSHTERIPVTIKTLQEKLDLKAPFETYSI